MNKQLLTATLVAAISSMASAETPAINHAEELSILVSLCKNDNITKQCPKMAKICPKLESLSERAQQRLEETGTFNWTQEEMERIEKYAAGHKHCVNQNSKNSETDNLPNTGTGETLNQDQQTSDDLAEKLNLTTQE